MIALYFLATFQSKNNLSIGTLEMTFQKFPNVYFQRVVNKEKFENLLLTNCTERNAHVLGLKS